MDCSLKQIMNDQEDWYSMLNFTILQIVYYKSHNDLFGQFGRHILLSLVLANHLHIMIVFNCNSAKHSSRHQSLLWLLVIGV